MALPSSTSISRYLDRTLPTTRNPRDAEIRILVPIVRAQAAQTLIAVGDALAKPKDADGKVLGLVEVPLNAEPNMNAQVTNRRRDLLRWIAEQERVGASSGRLGILVRVVHSVPLGIREAVLETGTNLLVVEWPGPESQRSGTLSSVLDDLSSQPPADLVLVRPPQRSLDVQGHRMKLVVPIRGGSNARLALRVAAALTDAWSGELSVIHMLNPNDHPDRRANDLEQARAVASSVASPSLVEHETADVRESLISVGGAADVLVLGAHAEKGRHPELVTPEFAGVLSKIEGLLIIVRSAKFETEGNVHDADARN
jgi:hypothetical protein